MAGFFKLIHRHASDVIDVVKEAKVAVLDDWTANNMATSSVQDTSTKAISATNISMDELYNTYHQRLVSRIKNAIVGE